jgi:hypothetical protein
VNANFGGSAHDSLIWRNSGVHDTLEGLYQERNARAWLIGDIKKALAIKKILQKYLTKIRSKKWYFPIFAQLLDTALVNAHAIFFLMNWKIPLLDFRHEITTNHFLNISSQSDSKNVGRQAM